MAPAFVQVGKNSGTGSGTGSVTLNGVGAGNRLVCVFSQHNADPGATACKDGASNTFTADGLIQDGGSNFFTRLYSLSEASGGSITVSVTINGSNVWSMIVAEYSGESTAANAVDTSGTQAGTLTAPSGATSGNVGPAG